MDKNYLNPKITVIMPVYNSEKYIETAIDSIINQTFTNFELLIIDDCSSDKSLEIIKSYHDQRIKLLQNDINLGVVPTRNKGLHQSQGEYIAFLDSDDYAYPSRLEEQLEFMENNPDFGMIGSWVEVINEKDDLTGEIWKYIEPYHKIPSILLFQNYFAQSAVFIRKSILAGDFYKHQRAEDYDLWVRIAKKSKVGNIQKVLIKYRQHSNSRSQKAVAEIEQSLREIVSQQLNYLGIEPTLEELSLHRELVSYVHTDISMSTHYIKDVANWLTLLRNANRKTGIYGHHDFNQVLADIQLKNIIQWVERVKTEIQTFQEALDNKNYKLQEINNEFQQQKLWIEQLQAGKDWLESQYYLWMQTAQQTQLALEQSQSQLQQTQLALEQSQSQLQQTQLALEQSQSQLQQTQLALEQSQSQLQQTQLALEQSQSQLQQTQLVIAEMQSSRFWKLRTQWFKLKRLLGVCE
ncbi:putative glycosyl transferase [Nostoc sp. NIES-3756]|uniref:glycosyltransferase family 2 protein n=1 Tax=Nostoc sp. NIES-3756 TaxID=1751286 RepID=UPI0007228844|nr:glycosyltransferase [Nostoc sp. NIES-3756]BAT51466.1 putative glycosyl transferase [Nostoc sp. NIES-3756]